MPTSDQYSIPEAPVDIGALFTHDDDVWYNVNIHSNFVVNVYEGTAAPDLAVTPKAGYSGYGGNETHKRQFQVKWDGTNDIYMWCFVGLTNISFIEAS